MAKKIKNSKQKISDDLKDLVIARLDVLSSDKKISIGSSGEFTKEELIECVKEGNDVGQKVAELEITFLKALKEGTLLEEALT